MVLLDRLINYIKKYTDVWFAKAEEVARQWISLGI
jgi:hypothetical protein